jgi:hypothetical protein
MHPSTRPALLTSIGYCLRTVMKRVGKECLHLEISPAENRLIFVDGSFLLRRIHLIMLQN